MKNPLIMNEIEKLKKMRPSIRNIFQYSPYETIANLHNSISSDFYNNQILSLSPYFIEKEKRILGNLLDDDINTIFFCGYSGNGKTTFLNWFLTKNENIFQPYYFNIAKTKRRAKELTKLEPKGTDDHISESIQQFFIKKWIDHLSLYETSSFIGQNQAPFSFYFKDIETVIKISDLAEKPELASEEVKNLNFNDLMHFLLIHLIYHHEEFSNGKRTIICFDNLDDLDMVFLSQRFITEFTSIVKNIEQITQDIKTLKSIFFLREYKFIFSLREGTYAELSSHTHDLEDGYYYKTYFRLQVSDKEIMSKRLWLAERVCSEEHLSKKKGIIDVIKYLNNNDFYSRKVFLPLFNLDNRKLITYLVQLGDDTNQNRCLRLKKFNTTIESSQTGARGMIYRGLINLLWNRNYLKDFGDSHFPFHANRGLCNPPRVILTALLNSCDYKSSFEKGKESLEIKKVSLFEILSKLKDIYKDDLILDILLKYFISHRYTWSHLITIYDKNFQEDFNFEIERKAIKRIRAIENHGTPYGKEYNDCKAILENVTLQINPSGFICLRYVITHFEYYSKLASIDIPLFSATDINFVDTPQVTEYEFEPILKIVYEKVKEHFTLMQNYYRSTIMKIEEYNEDNFSKSDLVCKHYRKGNIYEERPRANGYFHSTRIITKHIGYIDEFRLYLLNSKSFEESTINKMLNFNKNKNKPYINKYIIDILSNYIKLLRTSFDKYAIHRFAKDFEDRIEKIAGPNKDYTDFQTSVNIKRHE